VLFTNWAPYCLLGAGIVGLWLMQNAFSAGPLHSSLPTIAAGEPVAGIALGIVVFGDRIQISPGMLAIEAGGIAALIVGAVAVARSSAFGGLRKITDVITPHSSISEGSAAGRKDAAARPEGSPAQREGSPAQREELAGRPKDADGPRHSPPGRGKARTHRRQALADLRDDPAARPDRGEDPVGRLEVSRDRRGGGAHRRQVHGPASGEEGG